MGHELRQCCTRAGSVANTSAANFDDSRKSLRLTKAHWFSRRTSSSSSGVKSFCGAPMGSAAHARRDGRQRNGKSERSLSRRYTAHTREQNRHCVSHVLADSLCDEKSPGARAATPSLWAASSAP